MSAIDPGAAGSAREERWEAYPSQMDGQATIVTVDLACAETAIPSALPELHWVRLLPPGAAETGDAAASREDLEARLHQCFASAGAKAVGSITSRERRELYWYAPPAFDPSRALEAILGPKDAGRWASGRETDASWRHYHELLLPSAAERRILQIARALSNLAALGDRLEEPRPVEYRALFARRADAERFLAEARADGYRAAAPLEEVAGKWRGRIGVRHALDPAEIERRLAFVAALAEARNGTYEGWDTHAVRKAPRTE